MSDEDRKMDHKVVFEPYDMDTALGTNNSGVLMFSPYLEDTDTVSSVIAGGDSGGSEAPVYNAQDSVLWNNIRDAFRSELVQMYRTLRASNGPWQYNAIEKRFEDHQSKWPEAIFNEDAWVKYIIPLVDPVTVDEETGELIRTDRYLTMLQGSKKEQRKWWLYNRLRYLDSKYDTGNASANIINIRFFNGGVLKLKTAIPMYAAVSFGGGTTPEIKRTEANTEVSFTYTPGTGVTEMETWIHSGNLITDVGDLSVFYPNECDFSKASLLRRLKIGDATAGYSNANLTTINVRNSPLLESIDCRNCPRLNITVNLENSPRLAEAYFDGTTITGLDLADGCAIETLHLPATVTALTLLNLTKLQEFYIPSYANVARLMMSNIDYEVVNPVTVLESIHSNAQVNIQGLYLELDDAEAIGEFFDLLDTMTGVTRERSAVTGEWIYHDAEKAVVSGEVHTFSLTGEEIEALDSRYPYVRTTADHISTTLKYYNYDGSVLLESETILDGADGTYSGIPARADDADWRYTFIGWNTQPDKYVADADATKSVTRNRSVYAAYSRTSIANLKYYTYDGATLLYTETLIGGGDGTYAGTPARAADERYTYTFAGWSTVANGQADANATKNVTTHRNVYAAYTAEGQKYTVTFKNDAGTTILTVNNVLYGGTAEFTGTAPSKTGVQDPEMYELIGWNPSNIGITGDTTCYPVYNYLGIKFRKIIERTISGSYENSMLTTIGSNTFAHCGSLKEIILPNAEIIGNYAFSSCDSLSKITAPNVTTISEGAFWSVPIRSVNFSKVTTVGSYAFQYCSRISEISLPLVSSLANYVFNGCGDIESIDIPNLTTIGETVFGGVRYSSAITFSKLTHGGSSAFYNAQFRELNLPSLVSVGDYAFRFAKIYNISFPKLEYIPQGCFSSCYTIKSLDFPAVTDTAGSCFFSCYKLQTISFSALSHIGGYMFSGCSNLRAVILNTSSKVACGLPLYGGVNPYIFKVYVPESLVEAYRSDYFWGSSNSSYIRSLSEYTSSYSLLTVYDVTASIEAKLSVECVSDSIASQIESNKFLQCFALKEINLPHCTTIYSYAFSGCYALETVSLPEVTEIYNGAFSTCGFESVYMPELISCNSGAFYSCSFLKQVNFPKLEVIGPGMFYMCENLEVASFSVASAIKTSAFAACTRLKSVYLNGSVVVKLSGYDFFSTTARMNGMKIYVPSSLYSSYLASASWSYYFSNITSI